MKNVLVKLNKIQTELKAPKANVNKFGGYKYRSAEDILESLKPLLAKYGCVIIMQDDVEVVNDLVYMKCTAAIFDIETADMIEAHAYVQTGEHKGMSPEQSIGSASSYGRKYALNGLLAIDSSENDPDAINQHGKVDTQADMPEEEKVDTAKKVSKTHLDYLNRVLAETEADVSAFLTFMDLERLEDMTVEQFTVKAKPNLEKKAKAKK